MTASASDKQPAILKWANKEGTFIRKPSTFRDTVTTDGSTPFLPEKGRYHLYVSLACPWAHRTLIVRALKNLEDVIGLSIVDYDMGPKGWKFSTPEETDGCIPDTVNGFRYLSELYFKAQADYDGRYTVPVLWDKKLGTIVNNESSEIIRIFNEAFNDLIEDADARALHLYPEHLRAEIDTLNTWIYSDINNGVYKSGFATKQAAYEENCLKLFDALDKVEALLARKRYLVGDALTEADVRLFTTIVRFDAVYHGHFKCNIKSIGADYPNILNWARRVFQTPKVAETVDIDHIKRHYYVSHKQINPTAIYPLGVGPDFSLPIRDD